MPPRSQKCRVKLHTQRRGCGSHSDDPDDQEFCQVNYKGNCTITDVATRLPPKELRARASVKYFGPRDPAPQAVATTDQDTESSVPMTADNANPCRVGDKGQCQNGVPDDPEMCFRGPTRCQFTPAAKTSKARELRQNNPQWRTEMIREEPELWARVSQPAQPGHTPPPTSSSTVAAEEDDPKKIGKWERLVLHVAIKNSDNCNLSKFEDRSVDGKPCYNPYAVSTARLGPRTKWVAYDFARIPGLNPRANPYPIPLEEVRAYALLNWNSGMEQWTIKHTDELETDPANPFKVLDLETAQQTEEASDQESLLRRAVRRYYAFKHPSTPGLGD